MIVAIIPARGGSKRIPRKNIKLFCGKEMIAWSIEEALNSRCFNRVIVSTDDTEIAEVAKKYGAEVPFMRPPDLSDDFIGTRDVINHAINQIESGGQEVSFICCLYATAPFVTQDDLRLGLELLKESHSDFVVPVTKYSFPIQRSLKIRDDGKLEAMFPEFIKSRSQDLIEVYHDAAQFYWGKRNAFLSMKSVFSNCSEALVLPSFRVQDIDTQEDWERAELMFIGMTKLGKL